MTRRPVLAATLAAAAVLTSACATEEPFLKNREAAIATAKADTGCTEPMTTDLLNQTDAGFGGNRVRDAIVVVQGCGKTMKYHTTCEKTAVVRGCQSKSEGPPLSAPTGPDAPPQPPTPPAPATTGTP